VAVKRAYEGRRDARFVTIRRGGSLDEATHHLLALWAADCAERVLPLFEAAHPEDDRPRMAIEGARSWARGEITMTQARELAYAAHEAARSASGPARETARAAGHAVATAHMADHELGAAAYAIRAVRAASSASERDRVGLRECARQRELLPDAIRDLVISDQELRDAKFWSLFGC
jgi:hypothetical protein